MKSPKEQVKLTLTKGLMIEAHGTAFLKMSDRRRREIENEQPGVHRMETRRTCHIVPTQESHHCHCVLLICPVHVLPWKLLYP